MRQPVVFRQLLIFGVFIGLLSILFMFGKMQGGFVPWFLFYGVLVIALYEMCTVTVSLIGLDVRREFSATRLRAGETLTVTLHIKRNSYFPLPWMNVYDHLPKQLTPQYSIGTNMLFPWFQRKMVLSYACPDMPRGRYTWTGVSVQTGDVFGWATSRKTVSETGEVLVHPRMYELSGHRIVGEINDGNGLPGKQFSNSSLLGISGIRDYVHGDRINHIHWKATARGLGLKTKLFDTAKDEGIVYVLDCDATQFEQDDASTFERAVSVAASLIAVSCNQGHSVQFVTSTESSVFMSSAEGDAFLTQVLDFLAEVRPDGALPLTHFLMEVSERFSRGMTIACITRQVNSVLIDVLERYMSRGCPVIVYTLDNIAVEKHRHPRLTVHPVDQLIAHGR